jgi:hypothetical protein
MSKFTGEYPKDWPEIADQVREEAGNCCERCKHPHDPGNGYALTVHHLDNDKGNVKRWNLALLFGRGGQSFCVELIYGQCQTNSTKKS